MNSPIKSDLFHQIKSDIKNNHITMSAHESPQLNPSTSPQTPRVTFQILSTPNINTSTNTTQSSSSSENRNIELSWEEVFKNNLSLLFTKSFLAVLTSEDAVLMKIRDCVLQDNEARCKEVPIFTLSGRTSTLGQDAFLSTNASQFRNQLKKPY